jgi:hypothetical protein
MMFSIFSVLVTSVYAILLYAGAGSAQEKSPRSSRPLTVNGRLSTTENELTRLRADVLEKMKDARAGAEKLLQLHELEQKQLRGEYDRRRELYYQGLIARGDVIQAEHALATAVLRIDEDKRWLTETDIAITEYTMRDELLRLPGLAVGGYSESNTLLRFNGGAGFSLVDVSKIERFFSQTFGRNLPVSALGQTTTHDRMRFDHHNAVDVALHPDSSEGQSLLNYLRQAGIPFIAFRNAIPGAATGAHIHIGKPSPRT